MQKERCNRLDSNNDWSAPRKMDFSFYWFTQQSVALALRRAAAHHEVVPHEPIFRLLAFMREELDLETSLSPDMA